MKSVFLFAAFGLFATPANAEIIHQTSVVHEGRTIKLSYEPKVETKLRQTGLGPRTQPICFWKNRVTIQRTATTLEGETIAALSRVVEEMPLRSGSRYGYCNNLSANKTAEFRSSPDTLTQHLTQAASSDALTLQRELRELALLSASEVQQQ